MKMSLIQILLAFLSLFFIFLRLSKFIKKEKYHSPFKFLATLAIWGSVLIIALNPSSAYTLSKKLGMGESLNTLIFTGFIFVFIIIFKLLSVIERLERNISELVRAEALKELTSRRK